MDQPVLKPPALHPGHRDADVRQRTEVARAPASPESKRRIRTGWKAGIVRVGSFRRLQEIQKSTADPVIDLSYLLDACVQLALELGPEAVVRRAVEALQPLQPTHQSNPLHGDTP